jgi:hypothetical protein
LHWQSNIRDTIISQSAPNPSVSISRRPHPNSFHAAIIQRYVRKVKVNYRQETEKNQKAMKGKKGVNTKK